MNSLFLHSSLVPSLTCNPRSFPLKRLRPIHICAPRGSHHNTRIFAPSISFPALHISNSAARSSTPSNEGVVSVVNFEDLVEKDFSFLDSDDFSSVEEHDRKIRRIISAGEIVESSQVMVSISSEGFVDQLFQLAPSRSLLVVHDSILTLACIKEKYDKVKCWQGEVIYVPEKWGPFDAVFLYYLPAMPFELDAIFGALSERCVAGARLVISHPDGRKALEQERQQFPDVVVSDLPDRMTLQKAAADHSFDLTEFIDEHGFYLAILKFNKDRS
ncbi:hypothetical protein IC575_009884 [Cucumis melo]|uniref:Uncharacterized protein LOC103486747 n=1 Tax=Cucumis melo TaxID=3656 RepID=A0A1S3B7V6_CUCME|nr:uncharacterized protein LOC103486747 [Cucumis melo]XP_050940013.1 uncharacterized protein LOC103486747 [Cucumis melo]